MQETKNYQLNQWEPTDEVRREDFNQDNAAIDAALKAVADTAGSKASAAELAAVEQQIAAVEQTVKFVKLGGPVVTTTANQTVTFSLANIDMNEYTALLLVAGAEHSNGSVDLLLNGNTLMTLCSNSWSISTAVAWIMPRGANILGFTQGCRVYNGSSGAENYGSLTLAWNAVSSISASGSSNAGMSCTLYGLKV